MAKNEGYLRSNFAMALLAQGELEGKEYGTIRAEVVNFVSMEYLRALIDSPGNRRTALLVTEAARTIRTFTQVAQAQAAIKVVPFGNNDARVTAKGAVASAAPPTTFNFEDAKKPVIQRNNPDPKQQAKTGYLMGAPSSEAGGLSTLTVDNSTGERDAVVRLYLGGKKSAVRSMYIKLGEKFTSKSVIPGTYIIRYRFVCNTDTLRRRTPLN